MIYRNVKTGALIDICGELTGKNWAAVTEPPKPSEEKDEPVKEETKKKSKGKK